MESRGSFFLHVLLEFQSHIKSSILQGLIEQYLRLGGLPPGNK